MIVDCSRHNGEVDWVRAHEEGDVQEVVIRSTLGSVGVDDHYARNRLGVISAGIPRRGVYHYVITGTTAKAQYDNILRVTDGDFGNLKITVDVERTAAERKMTVPFPKLWYTNTLHDLCYMLRDRVPAGVRIYSNKWEIEAITTQPAWMADFDLWVAGYPIDPNNTGYKPLIPLPWRAYILWQYSSTGRVPGFAGNVDLSRPNLDTLPLPIGDHSMKKGTMYGIHAESASQAVPLMEKYKENGVQVACVLAHENPGLCVDAKRIDPSILTIARWHNPNHTWEGGQGVFGWSFAERQDFARKAIQLIFDHTNDTEYAACDYFCPGLNEWDPPEFNGDGYREMAKTLILLCDEASRRSGEMEALGLHPIRLAIPGFNRGTPEYNEMKAMVDTGLFEVMRQRGDILIVHEGVGVNEPFDNGLGDLIPGAPSVPPNAGSLGGRVNYLYSLGIQVPFVVTEWYDGLWRTTDPVVRLQAMKWYDRLMRRNKWFRGFCPFELTDIPNGSWWLWDFTPTFKTNEMLSDMILEKDKTNPSGGPTMPFISDADLAALVIANQQVSVILSKYQGAAWWETWPSGVLNPSKAIKPQNKVITFYHGDGTPFVPAKTANVTWPMSAVARNGSLLLVLDQTGTDNDWWVRAQDIIP